MHGLSSRKNRCGSLIDQNGLRAAEDAYNIGADNAPAQTAQARDWRAVWQTHCKDGQSTLIGLPGCSPWSERTWCVHRPVQAAPSSTRCGMCSCSGKRTGFYGHAIGSAHVSTICKQSGRSASLLQQSQRRGIEKRGTIIRHGAGLKSVWPA